jgi:hypothetical protein
MEVPHRGNEPDGVAAGSGVTDPRTHLNGIDDLDHSS